MKLHSGLLLFCLSLLPFMESGNSGKSAVPEEINFIQPHLESLPECAMDNHSFQAGERAVYTVYYKFGFIWLSAGEVVFTVDERDGKYKFEAKGSTYSTYDRLFSVRNTYASTVDKKSLMPLEAMRDVKEGSYTKYVELDFDYDARQVIARHGKTRNNLQVDHIEMNRCMHDVLSIVYYSRNLDLRGVRKNDVFDFNVCFDDETYDIGMQYKGREKNKSIRRLGNIDVIEYSPGMIAGNVFNEGDKMTVWVSDDRNRIPLQIESPLKVGSVRVVLNEYEGLKYPLAFN
nr:DUF3108 domain-containing protein [Saprospiraceae bacterium]